jgi:hypothetical protein
MNKLYRFNWDCGRQGSLTGTFVADEEDVRNAIGQHLYFGEVLGKHSDVEGVLESTDVQVLSDDQSFIDQFETLGCSSGYNPLNYLPEDDDDGAEEDEEASS